MNTRKYTVVSSGKQFREVINSSGQTRHQQTSRDGWTARKKNKLYHIISAVVRNDLTKERAVQEYPELRSVL